MFEKQPSSQPDPFDPQPHAKEEGVFSVSDDKEWFIRQAFESDPQKGVELLFRKYYNVLCSHAVRFVYSKELAQDLVGELFSTFLHKEIHRQIRSSFRAYLFSAVRFESLKYLQREFNRETELSSQVEEGLPSILPTPEESIEYDELYRKIEQVIQSLSPAVQRVFILNRFEGRKYHEIAQELLLSPKTVEAHMTKALRALRQVLKDY
ncbi:RNA polymerase sigma-70 factor [Larkinella bovis]|uniref:RNA polymerase sigma-70 factor n=1 Tax=Larkinella bovis TaxID=683041 RepID=A0ABW0IBY2_9BACT